MKNGLISRVMRLLFQWGVKEEKPGSFKKNYAALKVRAKVLRADGMTISQIAKELGVNKVTVWNWTKKAKANHKTNERVMAPIRPIRKTGKSYAKLKKLAFEIFASQPKASLTKLSKEWKISTSTIYAWYDQWERTQIKTKPEIAPAVSEVLQSVNSPSPASTNGVHETVPA